MIAVGFLFGKIIYNVGAFLHSKFIYFQTAGLNLSAMTGAFDPYFFSAKTPFFLMAIIYFIVLFSILFGRKISEDRWKFSPEMLYYFPIFALIAPFWILKAVWNTIFSVVPVWK